MAIPIGDLHTGRVGVALYLGQGHDVGIVVETEPRRTAVRWYQVRLFNADLVEQKCFQAVDTSVAAI